MMYFILGILVIVCFYFIFRYFSLIFALKKLTDDMTHLSHVFEENHLFRVSLPNRQLARLVQSCNNMIQRIQKEHQNHERKEKEFKKQIENISHDLRTPLTIIIGYLKIIKKGNIPSEEMQKSLTIVEHKSELMKNLVTQFYDYTRHVVNQESAHVEEIEILKVLRSSFLGYHNVLEKRLKIQVDIPEQVYVIIANEVLLERIFLNLFQNIDRYAESFCTIKVEERNGKLHILFINDSASLRLSDIPNLFERFYMENEPRNSERTGLGLTIAQSLVHAMNGELHVSAKMIHQELIEIQFDLEFNILDKRYNKQRL